MDTTILLKLLISAIAVSLFSFFRSLPSIETVEELFIYAYGTIDVSIIIWVIPVVMWLLPLLLLNFFLGDYVFNQLRQVATNIFTRTSKRDIWLLNQIFSLIIYVLFFQIALFITTFLLALIFGIPLGTLSDCIFILSQEFSLMTLGYIVSILLINILSLILDSVLSSALVLSGNLVFILSAGFLYKESILNDSIAKWFPFIQGVYGWKVSVFMGTEPFNLHLQNGVRFAAVYLLVAGLLVMLLGIWKIKKVDIY
ncbi:hypothetical protein PMSD_10320 [Paenibacillus macquariensis subsp. defensor]|nr:hypothetical protein PMSD_10320 [Paenibacillus macquariensis subsp. defensor]